MRRIRDFRPGAELPDLFGCIVTVGVFDGVHLGHRALIDRTLAWARGENRASVVLTFATHPDRLVRGRGPNMLQTLDHRLREFERCGVDATVVLDFDDELRQTEAEDFVTQILVEGLRVRGVVFGHDTAVGRDRRGDAALLDQLGEQCGFELAVVGEIAVDGDVVSSTRIRTALGRGDLTEASRLLGRCPSTLGRVVAGDRRGRELGFPTANLDVANCCIPADGVYAILVRHHDDTHEALCNIGRRPTFGEDPESRMEVHLLEFDGDLYGAELEVFFLRRLRGERKFDSRAELVAQIEQDRADADIAFRRVRGRRAP